MIQCLEDDEKIASLNPSPTPYQKDENFFRLRYRNILQRDANGFKRENFGKIIKKKNLTFQTELAGEF